MNIEDYTQFAGALDDVREVLRATVAGLVSDGFSEEQAREITAAVMTKACRAT